MTKFELQKLRDLPIEGVAERLGLQVTRHKCLCPFHDDHHASLSFSRRNTFRCFVCGESGDTISLVMKVLNKGFIEATQWLTDSPYLAPLSSPEGDKKASPMGGGWRGRPFDASRYARFFERPWLNDEAKKFLFEERKLDPRVVRWCRLTSWRDKQGVPWLQIPYYDREGKLIGIQNRNLSPLGAPRFRFPQGSECGIYNLPVLNLLKPGEILFITEGCSDCWAMLSAGHKAIAIPSATLLKRKDKELLKALAPLSSPEGDIKPPHGEVWRGLFGMYPDNDVPGERLFQQLQEVLPSLVRHQLPAGCKDFSEYYVRYLIRNS